MVDAGTNVWCRHKCMTQAQMYDAGTNVWCRHKCMMQAQMYDAGTSVWCRHKCMMQAQMYDAGTNVWCRHKCMMQAQMYDAGTSVWCRHKCMMQAQMYDAGTNVWCRHKCMTQAQVYDAGTDVWRRHTTHVQLLCSYLMLQLPKPFLKHWSGQTEDAPLTQILKVHSTVLTPTFKRQPSPICKYNSSGQNPFENIEVDQQGNSTHSYPPQNAFSSTSTHFEKDSLYPPASPAAAARVLPETLR